VLSEGQARRTAVIGKTVTAGRRGTSKERRAVKSHTRVTNRRGERSFLLCSMHERASTVNAEHPVWIGRFVRARLARSFRVTPSGNSHRRRPRGRGASSAR
jgi:hypothetical protein